ncbi:MAG TPA: HAD-IIB family hydrolase [Rhodothermales bacterium]|nr:HAD-IIB family hydrolase [Rhodothermales bacterium]
MVPNIRLFATDLDGTLLGVPKATQQFKVAWEQILPDERPLLCYSSGRLLDDALQQVDKHPLPNPDYVICGVGTTVYNYRDACVMKEFEEILSENWDVEQVEGVIEQLSLPIVKQPDHYQTPYKSSWYLDDASSDQIDELRVVLRDAALDTHVVYSSMRHLDVLPRWANKGNALRWLLRHLDIAPSEALVAGDSGNDSAMFALDDIYGIVVGNAQPELLDQTQSLSVYQASPDEVCAYGLLAGLSHYGIIEDMNFQEENPEQAVLYEALRTAGDDVLEYLSQEQLAFIRQGYHRAIDALQRNISPLGFTACSLEDNEVVGTDVNYRSVWGRDGALTILGSLPLLTQDDDIHACQRQTLITLLEHISPNGQIPANVRLADSSPDYSGVGGIASVDSGMWVIIAFYAYVAHTHDYDFLRAYFDPLKRAMDWLSAHDSNNDALLEIPEAGDWTDLFGRSYNVLYDEVLWYRSNICFGRLLQMKGDEEKAGDYLRWAQTIKREILANFWPSSQQNIYQAVSFADQQFSIGDARYLLAQLTPFDFSWRCDTFGNVLAYLYDVVDDKRASQTFRFMWGVGVNEPYPIANLYPAVSAGDKDWRPYYTVNLLNLPKHYHNGGIWPFVGGHWVRFIDKLGLRNLALHELYRLAELNKLGVLHEWEFNEWAHGDTGRPMGKAYQAWSASEFIRACHALHVVASS